MTDTFVPRLLTFQYDRESVTLPDERVLTDDRLRARPIIVLGEAGSGKSDLLRHWADDKVVTAKQLIHDWPIDNTRLFIDGLDEVAGLKDGDALDRVLSRLKLQGNNDFVIACRIADWRSASATETIRSWTGVAPAELSIVPLDRDSVIQFLTLRCDFPEKAATELFTYHEERGLEEWLGNPQTLTMLARVWTIGRRPHTTGKLFEVYVDNVWKEGRKQTGFLQGSNQSEVLDALGALFAALILGGYDAVTLAPLFSIRPEDLPLAECKPLPGLALLTYQQLEDFLNSRLVAGLDPDRFSYQHRRIGEYLAARWIVQQAVADEVQERVLAALSHDGVVPSNLRGLWGWLAESRTFAPKVIAADPLAVVDYANADNLSPESARALLDALQRAEKRGEPFGWRQYRAASLVQPALKERTEKILGRSGENLFWTQLILIQQMRDVSTVERYRSTLLKVMLDEQRPFGIRSAASDALAGYSRINNWEEIVYQLSKSSDRQSLRLALHLMRHSNVGLTLADDEFAESIYAYAGLTPRFAGSRESGTLSLFYLERPEVITEERLDGVLDALTECANRYLDDQRDFDAWDVNRLFYALLRRRLELANVDPESLWRWLTAAGYDDYGGSREDRDWIAKWLQEHAIERRAVQRIVLSDCNREPRSVRWRFSEASDGLFPSRDDVTHLLAWLPAGDARWRELIWLSPSGPQGEEVRIAAARHARSEEDQQILREHADPPRPQWEIERAVTQRRLESKQKARRSKHRANYVEVRDRMRRGDYGALVGPAQVYTGRANEVSDDTPPEQRIAHWIGEDLQEDAFAGFEAFLLADPPTPPTATEIAESHAQGRIWHAALILVAALAERVRERRSLQDIPNERIQAGFLGELVAFLDGGHWKGLRHTLIAELQTRGVWVDTARLLVEPQLRRRATYVLGLWLVLGSSAGITLAAEWLRGFPRMAAEPEEALLDLLLKTGGDGSRQVLNDVAARRRRSRSLDLRRRRNWQAVELLLGTLRPMALTRIAAVDPSFIWTLRDRIGLKRFDEIEHDSVTPELLSAIVSTFAPLYPFAAHPAGTSTGDRNSWDATDFLARCLDVLAGDPSVRATEALAELSNVDYGYSWKIKRSAIDQRRARANAEWRPFPVRAILDLVTDGTPVSHSDLQQIVLRELGIAQRKINSDDTDVWQTFYEGPGYLKPKHEEECTKALLNILRQTRRPIKFELEPQLSGDRRGDIWFSYEDLEIVAECKRHWHADLWTAPIRQLAREAADWRTCNYGIYIVYWFGPHVHPVRPAPRLDKVKTPSSPVELEAMLRQRLTAEGFVTLSVKVLDVSRAA